MLRSKLFTTTNIEKSAYIWNTSASTLNAFMTVLILMFISRIDPISDAGVFTIAFAVGNLMLTLGMYGIRQYQVSDVKDKYSFHDYLFTRGTTCLIMVFVSLVYVGSHFINGMYTKEKSLIIIFVCLAKTVDAFEDVFHGMFQKEGRLDVAGKILFIRLVGYIGVYICCYIGTRSLMAASFLGLVISLLLSLALNGLAVKKFTCKHGKLSLVRTGKLLLECFPLFISSYLVMYIANAPKYAIDKVLDSEAQACFNYIFMPVFVIGLMSQFVYQPIIGKLSLMWHKRQIKELQGLMMRQCAIIGVLSGFVLICGIFLGIPVLSFLFSVDLGNYKRHFIILLIGGVFLAYVYFFQMIMTIIRRQNLLTVGYCFLYVVFLLFGSVIVKSFGLMGISLFYMGGLAGLAVIFMILVVVNVNLTNRVSR